MNGELLGKKSRTTNRVEGPNTLETQANLLNIWKCVWQRWQATKLPVSRRFNKKLEDSIEQPQWFSSARPLWEVRRGFVPRFEAEIGVVPRNGALCKALTRKTWSFQMRFLEPGKMHVFPHPPKEKALKSTRGNLPHCRLQQKHRHQDISRHL